MIHVSSTMERDADEIHVSAREAMGGGRLIVPIRSRFTGLARTAEPAKFQCLSLVAGRSGDCDRCGWSNVATKGIS